MKGPKRSSTSSQERAHINTLFLAVFTYGRGIAGRQVPGQPLPDHGKQEYDLNFHGGNYATPHPEFYRDTVLKDTRAPDHPNLDILAEVLPAAKKRGMKTICWLEDVWRDDVPNIDKVQEIDLYGRQREPALFQQSGSPQLPDRPGGGLHALVRYRRHHVGLRASRRARHRAWNAWHGGARSDPGARGLLLRILRRQGEAAGHQHRPREGGLQGAGEVRPRYTRGRAARRRILRHVSAPRHALPRDPRLGAVLARRPARNLRRDLQAGEIGEAGGAGGLAHLAQQQLQPVLPRPAGSSGTREILGFPEDGDVSQLRAASAWRATSTACTAIFSATCRRRNCSNSTTAS